MNKQYWVDYALSKGFENFEIFISSEKDKSISWFDRKLDSYTNSAVTGYSFRGVFSGKMAVAASEDASDDTLSALIDSMIEQTKSITSEDVAELRRPESTEIIESAKKWVRPDYQTIENILKSLEEKILAYDERFVQVSDLQWEESESKREIFNSYGIDIEDRGVYQILFASAAASDGKDVKNGYKVELVEDLSKFDQDAFVKDLCDKILHKLGASSIPSRHCPVIFDKDAMTALFSAFSGMYSGELISKGISPLKDKFGKKIFSDKITIIDNPKYSEMVSPHNYDDEGCPTREKFIVRNGMFETILQNTKTGKKMEMESTGNGFKGSYASKVGVHPLGCYIVPGYSSLEDLYKKMGNGLVITTLEGLHAGLDHVTGDFSLQCAGYQIENGVRGKDVTLITVAGNFIDLMNDVVEIGNDIDWSYRSIVCPSIYFSNCAISGE